MTSRPLGTVGLLTAVNVIHQLTLVVKENRVPADSGENTTTKGPRRADPRVQMAA
jgi:hypothetical protein